VRDALSQSHQPCLREHRLLATDRARTAEELRIAGHVRNIQTGPIDRDQPPSHQERPRHLHSPQQLRDTSEQIPHRLETQPHPGLKDHRLRRSQTRLTPPRHPRQAIGQLHIHVLVRALRVQRHPDREVHDHASRQHTTPHLHTTRRHDHLIDHPRREHPHQQTNRHQIRQPTIRNQLPPPRTRHDPPPMRRNTPGLGLGTTASNAILRRSCARHSASTSTLGFAAATGMNASASSASSR